VGAKGFSQGNLIVGGQNPEGNKERGNKREDGKKGGGGDRIIAAGPFCREREKGGTAESRLGGKRTGP